MKYYFLFARTTLLIFHTIFLFTNLSLVGYTEIVNLPENSNILDLSKVNRVKEDVDELLEGNKKSIDYVTAPEAHAYLTSYVYKKYGKEKGQELIDRYFNDNYFGYKEKEIKQKTPTQVAYDDPYLFTHLFNMFSQGIPGKEETMEKAKERWFPQTHFLTPEQAFNAFRMTGPGKRFIPEQIKDFEEFKEKFPQKVETIFSSKYFGIPENPTERKEYFLHNSIGFFTPQLVKNIYEVAKKILEDTQTGDYIVIFGNTPYFVGRALQKLSSSNSSDLNYRHIIEFPFSGAPNRIREYSFPEPKDLVTKERLDHLKKRLEAVGLSPANKDLPNHFVYFVDVIASGSGPAYVIEELLREFKKAHAKLPSINIISLNEIYIDNQQDTRNAKIATKNAKDNEAIMFTFPSLKNPHFKISAEVVYLQGHSLLDQLTDTQWRVFPEYNAAFWQPEYDYLLSLPQTKTKLIKTVFEYFDTNIDHLIEQDKQKK